MRRVSAPIFGPSPVAGEWRILRRWRVLVRYLRIDTPTLWRVAAHAAVLVLTVGVVVVSRAGATGASEAARADADQIGAWAQRATAFIPNMVIETTSAGGNTAATVDVGPGFVSPGAIAEADQSLLPWDDPERHVLKYGETLTSIAVQFGIEPLWLLWANPEIQKNPNSIALGTELTVLPMKAVVHVVKEGDTVEKLAETYKAKVSDILDYAPNNLAGGSALAAGMRLIVPDGESDVRFPTFEEDAGAILPRTVASWALPGGAATMVGSGEFNVAAYGRITTAYRRGHLAVDIANRTGTPISAIDSGTVTIAGWYGWAGKAVQIDHGNGFVSFYAHMSTINVSPGQAVQRGQVLGGIGCTRGRQGRCTGPHLHLEVYQQGRPINPCAVGACY